MQVQIVACRADGTAVSPYPRPEVETQTQGQVLQAERRASADFLMAPPTSHGGVRYTHPLASLAD